MYVSWWTKDRNAISILRWSTTRASWNGPRPVVCNWNISGKSMNMHSPTKFKDIFLRSEYMCIANLTSWSCFHGMSWADVHLPAVEAYRRARGKDRCGSNWWILRSMPFSYCWWAKSIKSLGWQDPIMGLFTDVYGINNPSTGPRFCRSTANNSMPWMGVHPKLWMIWRFFTFRCKEMVVDSTFNFEKKRLTPTRRATCFL